MLNEQHVWPYWSVDLPGLSEANAHRLLSWAEGEGVALGGIAVDPAVSFSVHMDQETVAALLNALEIALRSNRLSRAHTDVARAFADQLADWASGSASAG